MAETRKLGYKWRPEIILEAYELAKEGMIEKDIAATLGICRATFWKWRNECPELEESLQRGKRIANGKVASALFRRACGYEYDEIEEVYDPAGKILGKKIKKKHALPDTKAALLFLANRDKDWRLNPVNEPEAEEATNGVLLIPTTAASWEEDSAKQQRELAKSAKEASDAAAES